MRSIVPAVFAALLAVSTAALGQRDAAVSPTVDLFFEATAFEPAVADAALARLAAGWQDGHAAFIVDLARFTRPSPVPVSQDLSGVMPHIDPQGAPAMPRYPGAHFGTLGSPHVDPTSAIRRRLVRFLERQTGQRFQDDLDRWRRWIWSRPYEPPTEYLAFKAALYRRVDPAIGRFFQSPAPPAIRLDEIEWAGVGVNDLAPLFYPPAIPAARTREIRDAEQVVGIAAGGEARAYARRTLARHLLVHDRVGSTEILVAHDPAGLAAAAYELTPAGGALLRFGTSGLIYRSLVLMFDERTSSLWSPLTGAPVVGDLAGGHPLPPVPAVATTWRQWRTLHPETTVVRPPAAPTAAGPKEASLPLLSYPLPRPPRLKGSAIVAAIAGTFAMHVGALPRDTVREVTASGRRFAVVTWRDGAFAVYDAGQSRLRRKEGDRVVDDRGRWWRIEEEAVTLEADPRERLPRVPAPLASWAVWHAHLPALRLF